MSTSAQDEFDALYNNDNNKGSRSTRLPDDRADKSDCSDNDSTTLNDNEDSADLDTSHIMPTATYLPTTSRFDANTGPKGVIADARSFETARKRNLRRTLYAFSSGLSHSGPTSKKWRAKSHSPSPEVSADEEEDDFMRKWRANRIDELASMNQDIRTRRQSPSQRTYGSLVTVDPIGYLDAVEKVPSYTTVVVLIYDDEVGPLLLYSLNTWLTSGN